MSEEQVKRIEPRVLAGFRDWLPEMMMPRERLMETARRVFRSFGFAPIDTPALEYTEILLGKGGEETDRQIYRFRDHGDRDVAMRFDLTVPLARFVAQHYGELVFPFKRYAIGTVWRGERQQRGRYREFAQCDFDTVGTRANAADIEIALVIHDLLVALGFERFSVRVNNRMVLSGLLEELGLAERATAVLRALDKLHKIGAGGVKKELVEQAGTTGEQAERVLRLAEIGGSNAEVLAELDGLLGENATGREGLRRLRELSEVVTAAGIAEGRVRLDVSIARGLDYYTGTVYESFLDDLAGIGSVCSGGRYDNLAGLYTPHELPGVGASLGLDRLLAAMEELGMMGRAATPAQVFIVYFVEERLGEYLRLGRRLRAAGIAAECYPEAKKIGQQLKYADRKGFRLAVIGGPDEFAQGVWQIKDLSSGESRSVADGELVGAVKGMLAG